MRMKITFLLPVLCSIAGISYAQTGTIKGTITTSDGKPAANVNVSIDRANLGTVSSDNGTYIIHKVPSGQWILRASAVGIATQQKEAALISGSTVTVDFVVNATSSQLRAVTINATRNKFANKESDYVAKMPLKNLENPQVYNVVTSALMKEQMITSFNDAMKNVTGVSKMFAQGGDFATIFSSRGFSTTANMRNGVASGVSADLDPANIARIEVLKGPAGTLFGSTLVSWGGMINRVTKQPYDHLGGEIAYTGGSYGLSRFTADINIPLTKDSTVGLRINAAKTAEGSFMDYGFSKSTFLAPTIRYRPNDRLTISLEAEFYGRTGTSVPTFFGQPGTVTSAKNMDMPYKKSFTNNSITFKTPASNIFGEVRYTLSDHWTSQSILSFSSTGNNGYYDWNSFTSSDADSVQRIMSQYEGYGTQLADLQQNFLSDYTWGTIRNRMVVGIDFYHTQDAGSFYYVPYDVVAVNESGGGYKKLSPGLIEQFKIDHGINPSAINAESNVYAAYISDVFSVGDRFFINAGLRVDRYDNKGNRDVANDSTSGAYAQTALSPKFGLVYQPVKDRVSVFANYSNGFSNNNGTDFKGDPFKPSGGNQIEGGVKLDVIEHRLSATVSYYNIHAANLTENDPNHPGFSIQDAKQTSQGVEVSITSSPLDGLNLITGYSYNYKVREGKADNSAVPGNTADLYLSYRVSHGVVEGLGIGFGGNYSADFNPGGAGFSLPSSTILNASVFYDRPRYRLGLKADNLTNQKYWIGWFDLEPQMLRRISATLAIKF